jgi:hypothetical protein
MGVDDAVVCKVGIEDGDEEEEEEEEEECNVCANKSLPLRRTRRTTRSRTRGREITQLSLRPLVSTNMSSRSAMCTPQN